MTNAPMKRRATMDPTDDTLNKVSLVERNVVPQGLSLLDPEAVAKRSQKDLVALAMEIQKADNFVKANACNKLQVIAEQIDFLKQQAQRILLETEQNMKLHHVACNFIKHPGHTYHLYKRESGQLYLSMLSPEEWGDSAPFQSYQGSYRLEQDQSWTPVHQIQAKDKQLGMLSKFFPNDPTTASILKSIDLNLDM